MIRHLLRSQHGGAALAQVNGMEIVAVGAIVSHISCRNQAGLQQPVAGAIRLDDMPDAGIARGEARRAVVQAIPSTSIIE